jgi:competence protein ComEA
VTTPDPIPARARARLGAGAVVVIVLVALAVTAGIGMIRTAGAPEVLPARTASPSGDAGLTGAHLFVHVSGAVVEPGLYRLSAGARLFDAVAAAGGLADDADAAAVNLARTIDDGEQIHVPVVGEAPAPGTGSGVPGAAGGKIDLNTADLATLDQLPRVGPAIAQRIIDWREANGRFTSVDDLLGVPGIGDKMLSGIRDLVTV